MTVSLLENYFPDFYATHMLLLCLEQPTTDLILSQLYLANIFTPILCCPLLFLQNCLITQLQGDKDI